MMATSEPSQPSDANAHQKMPARRLAGSSTGLASILKKTSIGWACLALQAGEASLQPMAQALCLNGLKIHLGPELRAMFPVVLNMGISGDIELNGLASPESLKVAGTIHLDGGEVSCSCSPNSVALHACYGDQQHA